MSDESALKGEADRYLIESIRNGDGAAYRQLVDRYSGRLRAYAGRRLHGSGIDPEDAVQECFLGLLQSMDRLTHVRSLQAYLFQILRNKIVDLAAKRPEAHGMHRIPLAAEDAQGEIRGYEPVAASETPSTYARREENATLRDEILANVLDEYIGELKAARNFRDLKVLELMFYASWRNREIARVVGTSEPTVTRIKQAALESLSRLVRRHEKMEKRRDLLDTEDDSTGLIRRTWQDNLLSCLKRSTLGRYALDTLEPEWKEYVTFHLEVAKCDTCQANLDDLRSDQPMVSEATRERIYTSSVGFLKKKD